MINRIIDCHCHILPGVDDGAADMEESLRMLRVAHEEGITDVIATPHYQSGRYFTPAGRVRELVQELQGRAWEEGVPIRLRPGTEVYYRSGLEGRLDGGELATMNGTGHVLVEFSPAEGFGYIRNAVEDVRGMGYFPILAHVERYRCLAGEAGRVGELRRMGCGIQANAASVTGEHGLAAKRSLRELLSLRLVDYIGTDAHGAEGRSPRVRKCAELLFKKYGGEYAEALLWRNAAERLLEGGGGWPGPPGRDG